MREIVWLFPIIFMLHEFEEIIGIRFWLSRNMPMLRERFPKIAREYEHFSTEGFALAIAEEYVLCLAITLISALSGHYGLWLGGFAAYGLHLIVHIAQSVFLRQYIPAAATSVITLPPTVIIIIKSAEMLHMSPLSAVFFSILGTVIIGLNLKLAHIIMAKFTLRFSR